MDDKKSYRQILKSTSLLGSIQLMSIIIGIIRMKFVAILLSATGMGILGLYNTTFSLIQTATSLGLSSSGVRDIANAYGSNDGKRIAKTVKILRRWVWVSGFFGVIVTIFLAPLLSKWIFNSQEHTWSFVCLSVVCLLTSISSGQNVLLQGMRKLKQMAKSTLFGTILGLIISIPLYYLYGLNGIVPSIIIAALSSLLISHYFASQVRLEPICITWKDTFYSGLEVVKLGLVMVISRFMANLVSYLIIQTINSKGGTSEVGLYQAGWTIATQYTGLVFTAMATDYYPRLAAINKDNTKMSAHVNQQAEMGIVILIPMLVAMIGFIMVIIRMLYTTDFLPIVSMVRWCMIGMVFRIASWSMGYIIMAKGDKKIYFVVELLTNVLTLILNIIGYWLWGLKGIGIAFFLVYFFHYFMILYIVRVRYNIFLNRSVIKLICIGILSTSMTFIICFLLEKDIFQYYATTFFVVISVIFSFRELNKRMDMKTLFMNGIRRL